MASRNVDIVESPCKVFYQWKSITDDDDKIIDAGFVRWDKENAKNVIHALPFKFALLNDNGVCFKGYSEKSKQGVWSNEVEKGEHEVKIKNKQGLLHKFKLKDYKDNKDFVEGLGAKYTKVIYGAMFEKGEWKMMALTLSGAALSGAVDKDNMEEDEKLHGWFNFSKAMKNKMFTNFINVPTFQLKKKGKTKFTIPIYELGEAISEEDDAILRKMTDELEEYKKYYYSKVDDSTSEE